MLPGLPIAHVHQEYTESRTIVVDMIGLLCGDHDTPFQVKDEVNQLQGVGRSSGIHVEEGAAAARCSR